MNRLNTDAIRAGLGLLTTQLLNTLVLLKVVDLDVEQLGAINLLAGTVIGFVFLFVKATPPA